MITDYSIVDDKIGADNQHRAYHGEVQKKLGHLWSMVGSTPMVELHYTYQGKAKKDIM